MPPDPRLRDGPPLLVCKLPHPCSSGPVQGTEHLEDFYLAEKCLAGDERAIAQLQRHFRDGVISYLVRAGAEQREAEEITDSLWADCLAPSADAPARLARYDGSCTLRTWLNTVALNRLLTEKRRETRWGRLVTTSLSVGERGDGEENGFAEPWLPTAATAAFDLVDAPLLELMRRAIGAALAECPAEALVMLQLAHGSGLRTADLAPMWGCSQASISRALDRTSRCIAEATLREIKKTDEWLELEWEDFMELCRAAGPALFEGI